MLADSLAEAGLEPIVPDGAYFIVVEISKFAYAEKLSTDAHEFKDHKFVKHLIKEHVSLTEINCGKGS